MNIDILFNEYENFIKSLNEKSDTIVILISVNYLEQCLTLLIKDVFKKKSSIVNNIFKPNEILSTFYGKAKLCYCLNLINKEMFIDLSYIAKIRNKVAHNYKILDFNDKEILDWCNKLNYCNIYTKIEKEKIELISSRITFIDSVLNIVNELLAFEQIKKIIKH